MRRRTLVALATAVGIAVSSPSGGAQDVYPEWPITLVVAAPAAGIDLIRALCKGADPLTTDIVAGQVDLAVMSPPSVAGHIRNNNITMAQ